MFSLIKLENSNGLSQVEDLIGHRLDMQYTHIQYINDGATYIGELGQTHAYFTTSGWFKYLADHISDFKFMDGRAVYHLVEIDMWRQVKPVTIEDLQREIQLLKETVSMLIADNLEAKKQIKKIIAVSNVNTRWTSTKYHGRGNYLEMKDIFAKLNIPTVEEDAGIVVKFEDF